MAITWKNISAPSSNDSDRAIARGNATLVNALDSFGRAGNRAVGILDAKDQRVSDQAVNTISDQLSGFNSLEEFEQAQATGAFEIENLRNQGIKEEAINRLRGQVRNAPASIQTRLDTKLAAEQDLLSKSLLNDYANRFANNDRNNTSVLADINTRASQLPEADRDAFIQEQERLAFDEGKLTQAVSIDQRSKNLRQEGIDNGLPISKVNELVSQYEQNAKALRGLPDIEKAAIESNVGIFAEQDALELQGKEAAHQRVVQENTSVDDVPASPEKLAGIIDDFVKLAPDGSPLNGVGGQELSASISILANTPIKFKDHNGNEQERLPTAGELKGALLSGTTREDEAIFLTDAGIDLNIARDHLKAYISNPENNKRQQRIIASQDALREYKQNAAGNVERKRAELIKTAKAGNLPDSFNRINRIAERNLSALNTPDPTPDATNPPPPAESNPNPIDVEAARITQAAEAPTLDAFSRGLQSLGILNNSSTEFQDPNGGGGNRPQSSIPPFPDPSGTGEPVPEPAGEDFDRLVNQAENRNTTPAQQRELTSSFIKEEESFSERAYRDGDNPDGSPRYSIGYGTKATSPNQLITEDKATEELNKNVEKAEKAVNDSVTVPLTVSQKAALTSLVYNVGVSGFKNSKALKLLNAGDYEGFMREAFSAEKGFVNANGGVSKGLINRRNNELALFTR